MGIGSTISTHELFDLMLAGNLPFSIPRWLGLFGYVPVLGGALLLIAEAAQSRIRSAVRLVGVASAVISVGALVFFGPWEVPGELGSGLWLGLIGVAFALLGCAVEAAPALRRRFNAASPARPNPKTSTGVMHLSLEESDPLMTPPGS